MTEAEWLACEDPTPMVLWLGAQLSERKHGALLLACCRTYPEANLKGLTHALITAERQIEGKLNPNEINSWKEEATRIKETCVAELDFERASLARAVQYIFEKPTALFPRYFYCHNEYQWPKYNEESNKMCCRLIREVLNPFASPSANSDWRSSDAVAIARTMYDSRDFSAMPILADALQDAGCDNDDILSHCRDANATHVRGCWVVDLVLGKE
jgi:hypothetical protein